MFVAFLLTEHLQVLAINNHISLFYARKQFRRLIAMDKQILLTPTSEWHYKNSPFFLHTFYEVLSTWHLMKSYWLLLKTSLWDANSMLIVAEFTPDTLIFDYLHLSLQFPRSSQQNSLSVLNRSLASAIPLAVQEMAFINQ